MRRPRRGWVLYDVISAIIVMSILGGILAVGGHRQRAFLNQLTDSRAATRAAEAALTAMQSGQALPADSDQAKYSIDELSPSAGGMRWVRVSATVAHRTSTLIGCVPSKEGAGGKP